MFGQLGILTDRIRDLAELIIKAAWAGATGFGIGALVATAVMALEEPLGFGWRFFGWWVVALVLFIPAVVVWLFARNARSLRYAVAELPERLGGLADDAIDDLVEVASAARDAVAKRTGLVQLVTGAWQLRKVAGTFREIAGTAAPVAATLAPASLLVTAIAAVAGVGVLGLAFILVVVRAAL